MEKKEVTGVQHFDHFPLMSNHHTVSHQPDRFVIDFKGIYPQFSPDNKPQIVVAHKVILLDPYVAKNLLENLKSNVKKYEENFGKIKEPEAVGKAKKERKKESKKGKKGKGVTPRPSYMG